MRSEIYFNKELGDFICKLVFFPSHSHFVGTGIGWGENKNPGYQGPGQILQSDLIFD